MKEILESAYSTFLYQNVCELFNISAGFCLHLNKKSYFLPFHLFRGWNRTIKMSFWTPLISLLTQLLLCILTLVSEGGRGRRRGNRGSRYRDGTHAYRLLHDTLPLHVVHHVFYGDMETRRRVVRRCGGKRRWKEERKCGNMLGRKTHTHTHSEGESAMVVGGKAFQRHFTGSI